MGIALTDNSRCLIIEKTRPLKIIRTLLSAVCLIGIWGFLGLSALAQEPGTLDPDFGQGGIVLQDFGDVSAGATAVAIRPDGKILVAGFREQQSIVLRYNTDGSLDGDFGTEGISVVTENAENYLITDTGLQTDGKIIVGGTIYLDDETSGLFLARLNEDGTPDLTWPGNGVQISNLEQDTRFDALQVLPDDKILLIGTEGGAAPQKALLQYTSEGLLDSSFSDDGIILFDLPEVYCRGSLATQSDGKIVVGCSTYDDDPNRSLIMRFNDSGDLDPDFGDEGVTQLGFNSAVVAVQSDDRIVAAGGSDDFVVTRLDKDGSLDLTFGESGLTRTDLGNDDETALAVAVQADGKIVTIGYTDVSTGNSLVVARYQSNGVPDSNFGANGFVFLDPNSTGFDLAFQSDRKIVVVGWSDGAVAVVRYFASDAQTCYARAEAGPIYHSVQEAIDVAQPGDEVKVAGYCAGVYNIPALNTDTFTATQVAAITKSLTMRGGYTITNWLESDPIANPTTIDAQGQGRVLVINSDSDAGVNIENLRLTDGNAFGLGSDVDGAWYDSGGGVYAVGETIVLSNTHITNSVANMGGGIYSMSGLTLLNSHIYANSTPDYDAAGGGISNESGSAMTIINTHIFDNSASTGGGISNLGVLTITSGSINRNVGGFFGAGGIINGYSGTIAIDKTRIISNVTNFDIGAIYNMGQLIVDDTIIAENRALLDGGGVWNDEYGTLILHNSTIVSNTTSGVAGGLFSEGALHISNTTIAHNQAGELAGGLGVYSGTVVMTNTTIAYNTAVTGSGIYHDDRGGSIKLNNTLVADNLIGGNCIGTIVSEGHNLDNDGSCDFSSVGDQTEANPWLGPLQDNGGSTPIIALLPGSSAIDTGSCQTGSDQRGELRPGDGSALCDIGAFEFQGVTVDLTVDKQVSYTNVQPGQVVTYTIVYSNQGTGIATDVRITDTLPPEPGTLNYTSTGALITSIAGSGYIWQVEDLSSGEGGIITVTGIVSPNLNVEGTFTNTVSITGAEQESDTGNNRAEVTATISLPRLSWDAPVYFGPEQNGLITLTATLDRLPLASASVWITTVDGSAQQGNDYPATNQQAFIQPGQQVLTFTLAVTDDTLVEGDETFYIRLHSPAGLILIEPYSATLTIVDDDVLVQADISVSQITTPTSVTVRHPLTFTVTVKNSGPDRATGIVLTDSISSMVQLDLAPAGCGEQWPLVCALPDLAAHTTTTLTFVLTPLVTGTLVNTVEVAGADPDPNWLNNRSVLEVSAYSAPEFERVLVYLPLIIRQ